MFGIPSRRVLSQQMEGDGGRWRAKEWYRLRSCQRVVQAALPETPLSSEAQAAAAAADVDVLDRLYRHAALRN